MYQYILEFQATKTSPYIQLDLNKEILVIKGRSYSDLSCIYFDKVINLIKQQKSNKLEIIIQLDYINSSSTKSLYSLFKTVIENVAEPNIIWKLHIDDEDLYDLGYLFKEEFIMPFEFKTYN